MRTVSQRSTDWPTLGLLLAMWAVLLGNAALYFTRPLPVLLHVLVAAVAVHCAFTVWHEAVHRNVSSRPGLNQAVGILGIFPYMTPWFLQRWIHLEHHRRLNERDDPNVIYTDGPFRTIFLRYPRALGYARRLARSDPRTRGERIADAAFFGAVLSVYGVALWLGVFWDAVLLWALPVLIAKVVMDWYINYLPHVGLPADRFRGTRIVAAPWLTPLVFQHNYHAIHHLWPGVPWHRYRGVFRQKRDYLREHGVPIEPRLRCFGPRPATLPRHDPVSG